MKISVQVEIDRDWARRHKDYIVDASLHTNKKLATNTKSLVRGAIKSSGGKLGKLATAFTTTVYENPIGVGGAFTGYFRKGTGYAGIFETGGVITPKRGKFLWQPTRQVIGLMGKRRMSPKEWIAKIGPLEYATINGTPTLVGEYGLKKNPRSARLAKRLNKKTGTQTAKIPVFFGYTSASISKKWNLKSVVEKEASKGPDYMHDFLKGKS